MSNKSNKQSKTKDHQKHGDELLENLQNHDDIEVVAEVDIDNKAVQEVVIIKDTRDNVGGIQNMGANDGKQTSSELDIKEQAKKAVESGKQKFQEASEEFIQKADDVKNQGGQKLAQQEQKVGEIKEQVKQKADELVEKGEENIEELKQKTGEAVEELKQKGEALITHTKEQVGDVKEQATQKISDVKEQAKDVLQAKQEQLQDKVETLKSNVIEKAETIKSALTQSKDDAQSKAEEMMTSGSQALHEKSESLKATVVQTLEQGKMLAQEKLDELDEKFNVSQQAASFKSDIDEALDEAKEASQDEGMAQNGSSIGSKLGQLGAFLGSFYASDAKKSYDGVDLNAAEFAQDAFHKQGSHISQQLLGSGSKIASVQRLVAKVVPQSKFDALSEKLFAKVASWANGWAVKDLQKDDRFVKLSSLTDHERDDFAKDVANQNRALAVVGSVAGLAGLKGVIADSAWLLMVSLKSVYQIATIYDQPLTGKDGIKLAYGVLSGANLDKLQEKQVLLTALALGNTVLANAKETSIADELSKIGGQYRTTEAYTKQFNELASYVDLDKFNLDWLHRILPIGSVAVGVHYNRELIDEVLGTALATFRPQRPKLLTDLSTENQAKLDEPTDKPSSHDEQTSD